MGYRPHPHKRRRSHSLATARSFVGYRPHPQKSPPKINGKVTPPFGRWRLLPPPRSLRGSKQQSKDGQAQVRLVQVVQRDGVIQRYWVSRRVLVAPSPVVALSLREALPLGVRGSFRCSRCRFGLVLPLFLALLRRCRRCRSSTIVCRAKSVLRCRAHR